MPSYHRIMDSSVDVFQEISRVFLVIMYALLTGAVKGYHLVKDKYLEYKYATDGTDLKPTERYILTSHGRKEVSNLDNVPPGCVYVEEWTDTRGHTKMIPFYEGDLIPIVWGMSPFEMPPAKCPWVWVGDKQTETDLTRTFDKLLVPGNVIKQELVSKLVDFTDLIYIETKTFNPIKFPGDGITIEADVD